MLNKNVLILVLALFAYPLSGNEAIDKNIKLDKNINNNELLTNILNEIKQSFLKYHNEFSLYKKDYIFSPPEYDKFKKTIDNLEKSFNILKFNLLNKFTFKDDYLINRVNIMLNEYKMILEYYKEYNILIKLNNDKDIEIQRSAIIENIIDKYILINTYVKDIAFYIQNIKKNIIDNKKIDSIIDNNKRIYRSELDMLLHNLLKIHKRKENNESILEHEKNLKIINNLLKISINKNISDCLININNNVNELYENYTEYNKIILEKNNESELKFILSNIDMSFNLTYEYIDKCKASLNE